MPFMVVGPVRLQKTEGIVLPGMAHSTTSPKKEVDCQDG